MDTLFDIPQRKQVESPKNFTLTEISAQGACRVNGEFHSRFPYIHWSNVVRNKHYVCFGLFYENIVYGSAIWSSPIAANRLKNGSQLLELRRLALCDECPKNTATWMLSKMERQIKIKFPDIIKLISYQDTEVHHGTIYKAANWIAVSATKSGLSWSDTGRKRNDEQSQASKVRWEREL
jgi:hypothetical protein